MKQETSLINTFRTIIYKQEENVNECMDWKTELSKRIKFDFHFNWINLIILRITTFCFAGFNSIVCILFYQSIWKYLCEKCWRSHFDLQIQEFNCLHTHFHSHSYFLIQYTQIESKQRIPLTFYSILWMLVQVSWFMILSITIQFIYLIVSIQSFRIWLAICQELHISILNTESNSILFDSFFHFPTILYFHS